MKTRPKHLSKLTKGNRKALLYKGVGKLTFEEIMVTLNSVFSRDPNESVPNLNKKFQFL